jgi:hypothetical protein
MISNTRHLILFMALFSAGANAAETHCGKDEIDYFSCVLTNSKVVSVCGSELKDPKTFEQSDDAWVQYRFGHLKQIEFKYPNSKLGSIEKFEGNSFHPYGEDHAVLDLRFITKNAFYSVELVSSYENPETERLAGGVLVELENKRINLNCRGPIEPHYWTSFSVLFQSISGPKDDSDFMTQFYKSKSQ